MSRASAAVVLVFVLVAGVAAYGTSENGVDAGSFVRDGVGSRAFGFAGAFVAIADDASATIWNPAGLVQLEGANLSAMHTNRFGQDISYQFIAATLTPGEFGLGISMARSSIDEIPFYGEEGEGFFSETQTMMVGSVGYDVGRFLDLGSELSVDVFVGANGKVFTHRILEGRAGGLGLDVSVLSRIRFNWGDLCFGYTSRDVGGTKIKWTGTDHNPVNNVPWIHSLGVSTTVLDGDVLLAADVDVAPGREHLNRLHLGGEYRPLEGFTARGGVVLHEGGMRFAYGGSVHVGRLVLDYAYVPHEALGGSHILSLSYAFPAWWGDEEIN
jgi:hypothetical protein